MSTPGPIELRTEDYILRVHSRVFEAFSTRSDHIFRLHVDCVAIEARGEPDKKGRVRVHIGRLDDGELSLGSERLRLDLEPVAWARFQEFVAVVHRVQAAGPEPW